MTRGPHDGERGVALLLVLWIFMVLGVIALDFARYIRDDAMAAVNLADETRGYYLALAGMNRAIFDREQALEKNPGGAAQPANVNDKRSANGTKEQDDDDDQPKVPPDGQWHEDTFAGGRYSVRMTDEGGRIPLNMSWKNPLYETILRRVATNLLRGGNATTGVDKRTNDDIDTVVDSILDWRDKDGDEDAVRPHGAESDYYLGLRTPYRAKNGRFDSPEELLLVKGITPAMFYGSEGQPGLRDVFSTYSHGAKINPKTAPAAVFQVLLDIDAQSAADLITQRDGDPDGFVQQIQVQMLGVDAGLAQLFADPVEPRTVFLEARADVAEDRNQSHVAAIADISADASETKIVRWLDRAPWEGGLPTAELRQQGS